MAVHLWTRSELLLVFNLYCRTPFGRLHRTNPDVIALAAKLGRTASAVAMKLSNFASFDPLLAARGIRGLSNAGEGERRLWEEFHADPERVAFESEQARENIEGPHVTPPFEGPLPPEGPSEREALRRIRLVQDFFRRTVVTAYGAVCAVCLVPEESLLVASHIVPWATDRKRRADPTNGLSLCALHDRAFDRGLMAVDSQLQVLVSKVLLRESDSALFHVAFALALGRTLKVPDRFAPDPTALAWHREHMFQA